MSLGHVKEEDMEDLLLLSDFDGLDEFSLLETFDQQLPYGSSLTGGVPAAAPLGEHGSGPSESIIDIIVPEDRTSEATGPPLDANAVQSSGDKSDRSRLPRRKTAWTPADDAAIIAGVQRHGLRWSRIAEQLSGRRSDDAVRNRWHRLQRRQPDSSSGSKVESTSQASKETMPAVERQASQQNKQGKHGDMWTEAEDILIDRCVRFEGLKWLAVAEQLPGRTESGCRQRWIRMQEKLLCEVTCSSR